MIINVYCLTLSVGMGFFFEDHVGTIFSIQELSANHVIFYRLNEKVKVYQKMED